MPYSLKLCDPISGVGLALGPIEGTDDEAALEAGHRAVALRAPLFSDEALVRVLRPDYTIVEPCLTVKAVRRQTDAGPRTDLAAVMGTPIGALIPASLGADR